MERMDQPQIRIGAIIDRSSQVRCWEDMADSSSLEVNRLSHSTEPHHPNPFVATCVALRIRIQATMCKCKGSDTVVNGYDGIAQSTTSLQVS